MWPLYHFLSGVKAFSSLSFLVYRKLCLPVREKFFSRVLREQQSCLEEPQGSHQWVCNTPQASHGTQHDLSKFHLSYKVQNFLIWDFF